MGLQEKLLSSFIAVPKSESANIQKLRSESIHYFESKGFPTVKDEEWKYTNLKPLLNKDFNVIRSNEKRIIEYKDIKHYLLHNVETYKVVFIDGNFSSWLSDTTHDKYDVCILSSGFNKEKYAEVITKHYAKIAKQTELVTLNNALAKEGAFIHIPKNTNVEKPIEVLYLSTGTDKDFMFQTRNLVVVEQSSKVKVIETHQNLGKYKTLTNTVTEIFIAENSHINYTKIQNDTENASLIDSTFINQLKDSTVSVNTFSFGGDLTRNNLEFRQLGSGCDSNLNGISILNKNQLVDNHTLVEHIHPNCESNETYKGIYTDESKGVFNGKVYVHQEAQKINAYQQNDSILLSEKAEIDSKPQLEIFADDVRCSHGCTIGQLDKDALFYLQSRGICKKEAKALLMYAFSNEALENITIPELKEKITRVIAQKLEVNIDLNL